MIYIVLGIVILVVSFVIALFSLIRESKKESEELPFDEKEVGDIKPRIKKTSVLPDLKPTSGLKSDADLSKQDEKFPWEESLDESSISAPSSEGVLPSPQKAEVHEEAMKDEDEHPSVGVISVQDLAKKQNS